MKNQPKIADALKLHRQQVTVNAKENQRLEALRNMLLPKLMSRKIDVGDVRT